MFIVDNKLYFESWDHFILTYLYQNKWLRKWMEGWIDGNHVAETSHEIKPKQTTLLQMLIASRELYRPRNHISKFVRDYRTHPDTLRREG